MLRCIFLETFLTLANIPRVSKNILSEALNILYIHMLYTAVDENRLMIHMVKYNVEIEYFRRIDTKKTQNILI